MKFIIIVFTILILVGGSFAASYGISKYRTREFEKKIKVLENQINDISLEKEKLKKDLLKNKESAEFLETTIFNLKKSIPDAQIQQKIKDIEKLNENYKQTIQDINNDNSNIYDRCLRLCSRRAEAGYPCKTDYCITYR